ncbi:TRAUB-domain-containing protein [Aspergillus heteromorphus CBS 117.55]|uniref:Protein BFR2 n=1 Tax=Aspergillus heteromorphus CBS 117.55 TaxID=1448321 RepID=A0A317VRF5_9EURO|nr:TRAUB-domain-containing protein [Aspergillus heteromorphus CBS 117.55]PWY76974.1 TRAUB-domain-containing protein [Aspergillus heteromorphus CBS 117.55]
MAPKSLAEQFADLEDLTPRDYDPEDLDRGNADSEDEQGAQAQGDEDAGREHYQAVGKGKLRKSDPVTLGKQYAGSKVSREALEADSDDDPFAVRSGDEDEDDDDEEDEDDDEDEEEEDDEEDLELGSDESGSENDEEEDEPKPTKKSKAKKQVEVDGMDTDESEEEDEDEDEDELDSDIPSDEDDDEDLDDDEEDEEDSDEEDSEKPTGNTTRDELRRLMSNDQKTIAATISSAAKADATKGKAVKQQRATFDALLNTRIKLQKGLTAINQLSLHSADAETLSGESESVAIKSAESAALALWTTLEDLRVALADAHGGKKRKRSSSASGTSSASLWKRMTELESDAVTHRRTVLDKWSAKVRGSNATTANARGKLMGGGSAPQGISSVLGAQVATETAAVKRARTEHSSSSPASSAPVYDDTAFYQSLLRELVEQRMASSDAITNGLDTLHLQLPSAASGRLHPVTGMRNDKNRREAVDTRASKGRKMRFDVHEKLQNFMAPEDRGKWTGSAREEFFASLLGRSASGLLREGDDEDEDGEGSDEDREEGGLKLFRG